MKYLTADDPQVKQAVERIRALRQLTATTGMLTKRTVNELLAALPGDVLAAVALELRNDKGTNDNGK